MMSVLYKRHKTKRNLFEENITFEKVLENFKKEFFYKIMSIINGLNSLKVLEKYQLVFILYNEINFQRLEKSIYGREMLLAFCKEIERLPEQTMYDAVSKAMSIKKLTETFLPLKFNVHNPLGIDI